LGPQPPEPRRDTRAWRRAFGQLLLAIHPDYRLNRETGSSLSIEYVRPLPSGLLASQNCQASGGSYSHSFAVLLTTTRLKGPWLLTPFYAGSRFDRNRAIQDQYYEEFGRGRRHGLHSVHSWRARAEELVTEACRTAEETLLPRYVETLARGKDHLVRLFETALASDLTPPEDDVRRPRDVTALTISRLDTFDDVAARLIVRAYAEDFRLLAAELPHMLDIVRSL
jgi:hypothetical protein